MSMKMTFEQARIEQLEAVNDELRCIISGLEYSKGKADAALEKTQEALDKTQEAFLMPLLVALIKA
jgi:hypothetical protein